ncbi:MAG: hypothetical protein HN576_09720 [Bacteriovoracaceae bacterium]|jgi:hypothetical protein|nr:hypothetical protein [Bacteriovoracaceae bacterium]
MKIFIPLCLLFTFQTVTADDAATQAQIEALKAQIQVLQKNQAKEKSSSGLKVKDYKNEKMKSTSSESTEKISAEDQKKLEEALKKGKKYLEERNKYLEELENE